MKVDLSKIDRENFVVRPGQIAEESSFLVFSPHIGSKWSKHTLIFRSSIWTEFGELISASFPKFFNWGEQPDLSHRPFSTKANGGIMVMEKLDGSTLIVSKYKGQLITRTRGTFDACILDNGHEIGLLIEKFPAAFDLKVDANGTCPYSLIFEWQTPNNVIVINHAEPVISLIGKINHSDYSLESQDELDKLAVKLEVPRPQRFYYDKIKDMLEDVKTWEGMEGVCVYSNYGQSITKIKSDWYLTLHRMKSELGSFGRVVDAFFAMNMPTYKDFYNSIAETIDFEVANRCIPHISIICDGWKEVDLIVKGMKKFVKTQLTPHENKSFRDNRKVQAQLIFDAYGKTNRSGYVFNILDGKEFEVDDYKKLLYQVIKEPQE